MTRAFLGIGLLWMALTTHAVAEDSPLNLADLEAYRSALASKSDGSARKVRFRDLWDRPEAYRNKSVLVEGRVARIFRQPEFQDFPPLVEIWVVSTAGDPFCLVCPQSTGKPGPQMGALVQFSGRFLRTIEYQAGDVPRLAPLIVGPLAPSVSEMSEAERLYPGTPTEWWLAGVLAIVAALILAGRHYARPSPDARPLDSPPLFVDGEPVAEGTLS